jgi:hypothetical protein
MVEDIIVMAFIASHVCVRTGQQVRTRFVHLQFMIQRRSSLLRSQAPSFILENDRTPPLSIRSGTSLCATLSTDDRHHAGG